MIKKLKDMWNWMFSNPKTCCGMTKAQITSQTREVIALRLGKTVEEVFGKEEDLR